MGNTNAQKGNSSSGYIKNDVVYVPVDSYVGAKGSRSNSAASTLSYVDMSISKGSVAELVVTRKTEKVIATREANRKMSLWVKR